MYYTQKKHIKKLLKENGQVSRNEALNLSITRLSAIILDLKKEGWKIEGKLINKDYVYKVEKEPYRPKLQIKEVNGQRFAVYV